ncbi:MAG: hypothetical protein Q9190_005411 [Brigantiaea leucoxantha]
MRPTISIVPLVFSAAVTSSSFSLFSNDQKTLVDDSLSVPGENPLNFCADPADYILTIDHVDLDPNPPEKGKGLTIKAKGNFTEEVEKGAYIGLSVKYGLITLVNTKADLCDQMQEVDEECPLSGVKDFTKEVSLPKEIPGGKYTVLADVYTKDEKKITCLNAIAHF